jgi:hypothetical protein
MKEQLTASTTLFTNTQEQDGGKRKMSFQAVVFRWKKHNVHKGKMKNPPHEMKNTTDEKRVLMACIGNLQK